MDKTIRKYSNFDEMKADEYRYWQSRPVHERVAAARRSFFLFLTPRRVGVTIT